MEAEIECPACGHTLSMFEPPMPSRGDRAASWVAGHLANWWFPSLIAVGVLFWVGLNVVAQPFEPYPVIVLAGISGVLSAVAACQGPLILLAQRRAATNDRARDEETFRVTTNSERDLHRLSTQLDRIETVLHQERR